VERSDYSLAAAQVEPALSTLKKWRWVGLNEIVMLKRRLISLIGL